MDRRLSPFSTVLVVGMLIAAIFGAGSCSSPANGSPTTGGACDCRPPPYPICSPPAPGGVVQGYRDKVLECVRERYPQHATYGRGDAGWTEGNTDWDDRPILIVWQAGEWSVTYEGSEYGGQFTVANTVAGFHWEGATETCPGAERCPFFVRIIETSVTIPP